MQPCAVTAVDGQNSQRNVHHVTVITGASGATKDTQMRWNFLNIGLILKFYYSILTGPPEKC